MSPKWKPSGLDTPFLYGKELLLDYRRLCQGVLAVGAVGSGKTSATLSAVVNAVGEHHMPAVIYCPKGDDRERWMRILTRHRAVDDILVVGPDGKHRVNFLEQVSRVPGADPATLAQMNAAAFDQFTQVAGRNQQQGFGDDGRYWHEAYTRLVRSMFHLFYLAGVLFTPADILRAVNNLPTGKQTRSNSWRSGYLAGLMRAAFFTCKENGWDDQFDAIDEYVCKEMAKLNSRTKTTVVSMVTGVCDGLVRGKAAMTLGTHSTLDLNAVIDRRQVILIDYPAELWGEAGRFITVGLLYLAKLAGRRREIRDDTPVFPLIADECQLIVTEDDFQHTAISRSARCPLVHGTQGYEQFWAMFGGETGRAKADVLTQNLGTVFCTRPTYQTAKVLSEQIGVERTRMRSSNVNFAEGYTSPLDLMGFGGSPPQVSAGSSEQYQPILRPERLMEMRTFGGEVDVLVYQPGRVFSNGRSFIITPFKQV